jgi:PAS domain S-box-containing protein
MGIAGLAGTAISHARLFAETQAARRRYASLFEDSIDPILITDLRGVVSDANQRAQSFLGLSRAELIGQSILQWVAPGVKGEQPDLENMQAGDSTSYEVRRAGAQGQELCFEVHLKRIDVGDEPFMQWILRDVAERVALDKLRSDLTSMIFHDLRSPLGNVISSLEVMDATLGEEDPLGLRPVLSVAQRSSRRLSRLIDSLLDLDRLEAGQAHLYKVPVQLPELLHEALEEVRPIAEAKGHTLSFENHAGELEPLQVDESMIRRVVINLLENAVKYTPPGGAIGLSLVRQGGQVRVGVSDTGPGIAPEAQQRIFEKFARLEGGKAKGLGLGLAFCRLAVEAHGGRIWVESEPPHGSTFYFTLPL